MTRKVSTQKRKKLLMGGVFMLLLILAWLFFSPNGALKYYRITKEKNTIQTQNEQLTEQNKMLEDEVRKLKNDPAYIEEVARKKYGYLKKNEIIFDFSKKKKKGR